MITQWNASKGHGLHLRTGNDEYKYTIPLASLRGLNKRHIENAGMKSSDPIIDMGRFDYLFGVIKGESPWPYGGKKSLYKIAALYGFYIITRHAFWDGNKRTGMSATQAILELNGRTLVCSDKELEEVAVSIGEHQMGFDEFYLWIKRHSKKLQQ